MRKMLVPLLAMLCHTAIAGVFKYEGLNYETTSETSAMVLQGDYSSLGSFSVGDGYVGDIVIPEQVTDGENWYAVTAIDNGAFQSCNKLSSITLPSTMLTLGDMPFSGCSSLMAIEVSANNPFLYSQDGVLFDKNMRRLMAYPGGRTGEYAVPSSVIFIEDGAFMGCSRLSSIILPNTVASIGKNAFRNCSSLIAINLPEGIGELQLSTFEGCGSLSTIILPSTLVFIDEYVFRGCTSLESLQIPEGVMFLDANALRSCSSLKEVALPSTLQYIGADAFSYCSQLSSITIPSNVTDIGMSAFYACSSLQAIYAHPTVVPSLKKEVFSASTYSNAVLYVPRRVMDAYKTAAYWKKFKRIENVPEEVAVSPEDCFAGCSSLMHVSLQTVEMGMTECCFDLHLPEGVKPLMRADGGVMASLETERFSGGAPSLEISQVDEVTWHVTVNTGGGALVGNEGLLMHLYVDLDDDMAAGNADGYIDNAVVTGSDGETCLDESGFVIDVLTALLGDVDRNGSISVTDVTFTVDYILGNVSNYIWQLGDMNKDGLITVGDITMLVDTILSNNAAY